MRKTITQIAAKPKSKNSSQVAQKKRVAAYTRVSTEQDEQLNSLAVQQRYFEELINKNPEWTNAGIYYDQGISGTSLKKRDGFNRLISDAIDGKVDLILVKSISRFSRNTVDALQTIRALKSKGITVFFEKENIDSLDMKSEFILTIMSSLAQEESQSLSENIKWGKRKICREGKVYVAYSQFLGYKQGGKYELVIDREQAKIVKLIYRLYLEGDTPTKIAKALNESSIPSPKGKKWTKNVIVNILSNEKYCGDAILQKSFVVDFISHTTKKNEGELPQYYVRNDHPAIIKRATWEETQVQLQNRTSSFYSCGTPFSYKLFCSKCGSSYQRKPMYHEYYVHTIQLWICKNRFTDIRCDNIKLFERQLEVVFHDAIIHLYSCYEIIFADAVSILDKSIKTKARQNQILRLLKSKTLSPKSIYERKLWRILIAKVDVHQDRKLTIYYINGTILECKLPKWKIKANDID